MDHNVRTIDGKNTLHCMGAIAMITPRKNSTTKCIRRQKISDEEILQIGGIEKHFFSTSLKKCKQERFEIISPFLVDENIYCLDIVWSCTWLLSPNVPLRNGFMEMFHKEVSTINLCCFLV